MAEGTSETLTVSRQFTLNGEYKLERRVWPRRELRGLWADGEVSAVCTYLCLWSQVGLEMASLGIDYGAKWGKEKRKKVLPKQASKQQTHTVKKVEIDFIFYSS